MVNNQRIKQRLLNNEVCTSLIKSMIYKRLKEKLKEEVNKIKLLSNIPYDKENPSINELFRKNGEKLMADITELDLYLIQYLVQTLDFKTRMMNSMESIKNLFDNNEQYKRCSEMVSDPYTFQTKYRILLKDIVGNLTDVNKLIQIFSSNNSNSSTYQQITQESLFDPRTAVNNFKNPKNSKKQVRFKSGGKKPTKKTKKKNMKKGKKTMKSSRK